MRLISDLETNGLLDTVSVIHCIVNKDPDTNQVWRYHDHPEIASRDGSIDDGIKQLQEADEVVFHNGIKYDAKVLLKLKGVALKKLYDTIVVSRLIWPELKPRDAAKAKQGKYPGKLVGKHSLEAWGYRLGNYKGDYKGPWDVFSVEMLDYCVQDIEVTHTLLKRIEAKQYSAEAIELEHDVQTIIAMQEDRGFAFNEAKAGTLYATLVKRRIELEAEFKKVFHPWYVDRGVFTPERDNKKQGYVAGAPFTRVELTEFNASSRDHIADRLINLYGWKPTEFTDSGKAQVDEKTMSPLKYPVTPLIMEYLLVDKRIGQIAEGKEAWLKAVRNGRIHGAVNTNGAVTGRMTHFKPNIAQVPKCGSPYGEECRELFEATAGWVLVGADAAGLELRCLAHYLARWDGGAYAKAVIQGKQEDQSDVHSLTAIAIGLDPQRIYTLGGKTGKGRDFAKTFIYAFLYGAGDAKLGSIVGRGAGAGRKLKLAFISKIPGMKDLKDAVAKACKRGFLVGLDGRRLHVRSEHAALNTLLQSAGAIVMKRALVNLHKGLTASAFIHARDYGYVANVHDEFQIETLPENAKHVGTSAVEAIRQAGTHFNFRCPLDGEYKVGANWSETH